MAHAHAHVARTYHLLRQQDRSLATSLESKVVLGGNLDNQKALTSFIV